MPTLKTSEVSPPPPLPSGPVRRNTVSRRNRNRISHVDRDQRSGATAKRTRVHLGRRLESH